MSQRYELTDEQWKLVESISALPLIRRQRFSTYRAKLKTVVRQAVWLPLSLVRIVRGQGLRWRM